MMKVVTLASRMADSAFFIAQFNGAGRTFGGFQFFPYAFKDQHIGIDGHTNRQNDTGNTWQCQRCADQRQQTKHQTDVNDQSDIGKNAEQTVAERHEGEDRNKGDNGRNLTRVDAVLSQFGTDGTLFEKLQLGRKRTGAQQNGQICAFFNGEVTGDDAGPTREYGFGSRGPR